jgi:ZIP family zinc transporter
LAAVSGLATSVGGLIGHWEHVRRGQFRKNVLAAVVSLGGGLLLAAVTLVLVPAGSGLRLGVQAGWIAIGAITFLAIDQLIALRGGNASQLMASAMDSVPESLGLGAALAVGGAIGPLLVLLLGLQNIPEGFNAFGELRRAGHSVGVSHLTILASALLSPMAAAVGYFALATHPLFVAAVFEFSAGGILYLIFQDIAPLAHQEGHWVPTLGAIAGFLIGLVSVATLSG